jgi:nitroimidazol reductase NimA-like FMN-containing flavoprotein (pyridoxamine 5'-phosphate oxidase superfamily)
VHNTSNAPNDGFLLTHFVCGCKGLLRRDTINSMEKGKTMFREMRRNKQLLSKTDTEEILRSCTSGVLATSGDNGYPYAVPLSFSYKDGKLYFHFAKEGHKFDSITRNDKVSFCVIKTDNILPEKFTTHYRSVIVFGRARILTEDSEKKHALECLVEKYSPTYTAEGQDEIRKDWERVSVAEIRIEHMTGKASLALINNGEG